MTQQVPLLINGELVQSRSENWIPVTNPATQDVIAQVPCATADEVDQAVEAAKAAFESWKETPVGERARLMLRYQALLKENHDQIAELLSQETGKTFEDAKGDVWRGIEVVEHACNIASLSMGETVENVARKIDCYSITQPLGVCVGITPFNFPAMIPLWMFPLAIACGNTFVLKPSEQDPLVPMRLAGLFMEAGAPDGLLQVIHGGKEVVDLLLVHPDVRAISFVGSVAAGQHIYRTGTDHLKRVQAFCGAKNHMVVLPDADIDKAADALMGAGYGSAGERCMAISVAVCVGDEVADSVVSKSRAEIADLKVGTGTDTSNHMGPLVTQVHYDKVRGYVYLGIEEGADLVADGRGLVVYGYEDGFFLGPCLFDNVTSDMRFYQEEIFGPVLAVVRVPDYQTGVDLINQHQYGNGTAIFTRDGDIARNFTRKMKVGMVGVNVPLPVPLACHSFGGWKRYIFGDHHMYGPE